jgi:membrane-associated phospholipid phosphatase
MLSSFIFLSISLDIDLNTRWLVILITLLFGFIIPIVYFLFLLKKGEVINEDALIKEERTKPFITGVVILCAGFIVLVNVTSHPVLIGFWICYIINAILITIINKFWKISAHTMGSSAPLALLVILFPHIAFFYMILVLLIGWSRLKLKCHNTAQIIAGILVGFLSTYIQLNIIIEYFDYGY